MLYQNTNYGIESTQKILSITCIIAHHKFSVNKKKVNNVPYKFVHTKVNMRCKKKYTRFSIGFSMIIYVVKLQSYGKILHYSQAKV